MTFSLIVAVPTVTVVGSTVKRWQIMKEIQPRGESVRTEAPSSSKTSPTTVTLLAT